MSQIEEYKNTNRDEFKIIDYWKLQKSPIALFIEEIENAFGLVIHYSSGNIISFKEDEKPHLTEEVVRIVTNTQMLTAEKIYYDDKQLFLRLVKDQSIRKITLKVINEVHWNGKVYKFNKEI